MHDESMSNLILTTPWHRQGLHPLEPIGELPSMAFADQVTTRCGRSVGGSVGSLVNNHNNKT